MTTAARLETEDLGVHFGARSALEAVSIRLDPAETVGLVGPNGAGKSTLLKALAGMLPPSHGVVRLDGVLVRRPNPAVVYVPQRTGVDWSFPVSVLDVVLMGQLRRRTRFLGFGAADREAAVAALERVGMDRFAGVQIGQLSGGQQQRVFLARALLQDGAVFLLDEPFAGVDIPTQELLIDLFDRLGKAGKTIVYATHDLAHASRSSDRVLLVNRRLIASGPPAAVMTAGNLRAAFGGQAIVLVEPAPAPAVGQGAGAER
ncbi:MAG: Manganese ABC transporter, ATP-binding protein SitB [uncultured Thermomicrobiales bacterium]|uniref:Manganese ABC transporter, ATP-binding protein SitB n=1 Tax=uncultured Thermomicrobiales bacterium TaxID=1645740 RepID=A0A6J4TVK6_9BACT|nr:MAG: Manganese ABC transporter, ATP-binding protein SitB [uncultured Thermomicrobiales bacterium]